MTDISAIERGAKMASMVVEMLAEDVCEGGTFDKEGFSNFFPEEAKWLTPDEWQDVWAAYLVARAGQ